MTAALTEEQLKAIERKVDICRGCAQDWQMEVIMMMWCVLFMLAVVGVLMLCGAAFLFCVGIHAARQAMIEEHRVQHSSRPH